MATDTPYETLLAMKRLKAEGIWYKKLTPFHLKVDRYNFWPKRGTIHIDGETSPVPQRGLEKFVRLIKTDAVVMDRLRHNADELRPKAHIDTDVEAVSIKLSEA
ncbi:MULTISPECIES: hypothetical protein [unclassified Bradyrhizobium]|uniref:hypothetical protein n=1 Tax=unclassified Bradyrhizobium TaxID=2631580 RepID=UPI001CD5F888|nr:MULTISPECIES: hypothetical protein [unclassified Bradyrhizobium]MCA1398401.1 hypothetical protein [Bradyrhizobium sp. BRP56]UWU92664.1 hypothetical protein N2604_01445 [Bradyrhizobium sp. CB1015]